MDDRRHDLSTAAPGVAVADEQAVAEERRQAMPHLRAFPLETVVMFDKSAGDGVRAVTDEQCPR